MEARAQRAAELSKVLTADEMLVIIHAVEAHEETLRGHRAYTDEGSEGHADLTAMIATVRALGPILSDARRIRGVRDDVEARAAAIIAQHQQGAQS
jgi:hypothetical protein